MVSSRRARRCPIWWCELHATDWLITADPERLPTLL